MAPFVERDHFVQNLGDGTFFHSGSLAIRAVDRGRDRHHLQAAAQRHRRDDRRPGRRTARSTCPRSPTMLMAEGADADHRHLRRARPVQGRDVPERRPRCGTAAASTRRSATLADDEGHDRPDPRPGVRRREATGPQSRPARQTPGFRVVINERICEGCGDCGDKSNCLSVQPIDTPYGRKTAIHQTSCNFDFSCLQGDCPAFATVIDRPADAAVGRAAPIPDGADEFPTPTWLVDPDEFTVRLSGIGGTGVVTVSQVIGTAAMLDGFHVRGLDQTGLSQKAGPVISDVRMARDAPAESNHALVGGVDCYLAFDMLAGAGDRHLAGAGAGAHRRRSGRSTRSRPARWSSTRARSAFPERRRPAAPARPVIARRAQPVRRRRCDHARPVRQLGVGQHLGARRRRPDRCLADRRPTQLERAIELNGVAVDAEPRRVPVRSAVGRSTRTASRPPPASAHPASRPPTS